MTQVRDRVVYAWWLGSWATIGGLAVAAAARLVAWDRFRFATVIDAYTFWLYLPSYAIVLAALLARRWRLAIVALLLVALHVALVLPAFTNRVPVPAAAGDAPHVRVVTANLRYDNDRKAELARELSRTFADVMLLQEVTPKWWATLRDKGVLRRYATRMRVLRGDAGGMALLSREPLVDVRTIDVDGWPLLIGTLRSARGAVRIVNVHPVPPIHLYARHRRMIGEITRFVRARVAEGVPTIVAGDFNATPYNRWMHTLVGLGLRSAHEQRGRSLATTWPNGRHLVPPLRLDHVLVTDTLLPLSIREGHGAGADHRPVIADVAVLG